MIKLKIKVLLKNNYQLRVKSSYLFGNLHHCTFVVPIKNHPKTEKLQVHKTKTQTLRKRKIYQENKINQYYKHPTSILQHKNKQNKKLTNKYNSIIK